MAEVTISVRLPRELLTAAMPLADERAGMDELIAEALADRVAAPPDVVWSRRAPRREDEWLAAPGIFPWPVGAPRRR